MAFADCVCATVIAEGGRGYAVFSTERTQGEHALQPGMWPPG
jgi:hypothetical protein